MLIVTLTRDDLRDEFAMADEAYALSPVAARATPPSEAEYNAISDAFMETSRGRWFLDEYARRNRNADTRMVLDAVARIEATIATQKSGPTHQPADAWVAIRSAVENAKANALTALSKLSVNGHLAPPRNDVQTIRKIVWTLRECGTDLRLCDLLDAQAKAIETSLDLLTAAEPHDEVIAEFDSLLRRIDSFTESDAASASYSEASAEAEARTPEPTISKIDPTSPVAHANASVVNPSEVPDTSLETAPPAPAVESQAAAPTPVQESLPPNAAETAHDDAVLDLIAMEMGAPDPEEAEALVISEPEIAQRAPESRGPTFQFEETPAPAQASLGAVLLANGTIPRPRLSTSKRFSAIRRMSQAEKVALFS
jgi:hypothetical protein